MKIDKREKDLLLKKLDELEILLKKVYKGDEYFLSEEFAKETEEKKDKFMNAYHELVKTLIDVINFIDVYIKLKDDFSKFDSEMKSKYKKIIENL